MHRKNNLSKTESAVKKFSSGVAAAFRRFSAAAKSAADKIKNRIFGVERTGVDYASEHTQVFDSANSKQSSKTNLLSRLARRSARKPHKDNNLHTVPHISAEHLTGEGKEPINMFSSRRSRGGLFLGITLSSVKLILLAFFMLGAAGLGAIVGIAKGYMETTPKLDTGKIEKHAETSYIYDCDGKLITAYAGVENRDIASIDEIPETLQNAFIAIEDVRFKYHSGVDLKRLVGVFISNLTNSNIQGGSTITQQLIKNKLLSFERTYKRKIQEAYLSMQLEQAYTKEEILEAYLNTIHLGGSNYGVKAAAMDYFGKSLSALTVRECAMLAGITQYPYQYNPRRCYYVSMQPELINDRTDEVLKKMYTAGFISLEQYNYALNDAVSVIEESQVSQMYEMPYFVEYAIYDVITHLLKQRNLQDTKQNRSQIENELRTNGYKIYTTVDPKIQKTVEQSLSNWSKYPRLANSADSVIRDESSGVVTEIIQPQAAAVVVEQSTGELKAVVGGRTTPTAKKTLNRAYQNKMPVGSSIKPIAVYAPAIDKGFSDGTVIPNLPLPIEGWKLDNGKIGYPAGGASSYGPVTLRSGVVNSLNSASAYLLMNHVLIKDSYNYLVQMGINPVDINQTGSGLALGSSGITPIELAGAYATIANSGIYLEPLSFRYVEDKYGNKILNADDIRENRRVFKESTAWIVTDILTDAVQSGTGKKARISGMTIGGKTGTNQESRGILFAGISPYYTATLWIGHDLYKPLHKSEFASSSAAPLWKDFMSKILEGLENKPIIDSTPAELKLVKLTVCSVSGKIATEACQHDLGGHKPVAAWFAAGTEPIEKCDWHALYKICPDSGKIAGPYCPVHDGSAMKSLLFVPQDSIYWKLTKKQRDEYLPGMLPALEEGETASDIGPDSPLFKTFFCDIHTEAWNEAQIAREAAIDAAQTQINYSESVLSNPDYEMPNEDRNNLSNTIKSLKKLIANAASTTGAIKQKTDELKTLTDMIVILYAPET